MLNRDNLLISESGSNDWQAVCAGAITDPAELCRLLHLAPRLAAAARRPAVDFPLLVPRPYLARIKPGDPDDPLLRQVLPRVEELSLAPGFSADPLGESAAAACPGLLRKYYGRSLILATGACPVHCRFCFRRHFLRTSTSPAAAQGSATVWLTPGPMAGPTGQRSGARHQAGQHLQLADTTGRHSEDEDTLLPARLAAALEILAADPSLSEVILSGGDPLCLADAQLGVLLGRLQSIDHVRRLRIHTRMPIVVPHRVTGGLVGLLRGTRLRPLVVVHVNHPAEIDQMVEQALARLLDAGIPVLSQTVLLRGVNDTLESLADLYERLADLGVIAYYLHQLDRVAGAAHFEVPVETGKRLLAELRVRLPGYAVPRYVRELPGAPAKQQLV